MSECHVLLLELIQNYLTLSISSLAVQGMKAKFNYLSSYTYVPPLHQDIIHFNKKYFDNYTYMRNLFYK